MHYYDSKTQKRAVFFSIHNNMLLAEYHDHTVNAHAQLHTGYLCMVVLVSWME